MLGLKIESAADGSATVRMPFDLRLLNEGGPTAPVHGGAIAALADVAACAAVWSLAATTRTATISITVNYTGFAVNSDLIARARVKRTRQAHRERERGNHRRVRRADRRRAGDLQNRVARSGQKRSGILRSL